MDAMDAEWQDFEESSYQEISTLSLRLTSEDQEQAASSAEELVDLLLILSDDARRQEQIGGIDSLRNGFAHLLCHGDENAQYWACLALSYVAHRNATNIRLIGRTPDIFRGLLRCLQSTESRGVACGVLSQLAFCNRENGESIADTEGLLESLAGVVQEGRAGDRQAATCALSNCAANSKYVALRISRVPGMIQALKRLCATATADETAPGEDGRAAVSAIGCMDNLSHYQEVRPLLRAAGVPEALAAAMAKEGGREGSKVMAAESFMILTRLAAVDRLHTLHVPESVLETVVHCVGCALDRQQWANFAWRLSDVLEPLAHLTAAPSHRPALARFGAVRQLLRALSLSLVASQEEGRHEHAAHCVLAVVNLADSPLALPLFRAARVLPDDVMWQRHAHGGEEEEGGGAQRRSQSAEEVLLGVRGPEAQAELPSRLWVLRDRHLAVAMAQHQRLGSSSLLMLLDCAVLREIVDRSCTAEVTASSLAAWLAAQP